MARLNKRLSARGIATLSAPGKYVDGDGLNLIIGPTKAKRWVFIFHFRGERKEMGLGPLSTVSLADAREAIQALRKAVREGRNPIEDRRTRRALESGTSFGEVADQLIASLRPGWKNEKHAEQWVYTLKDLAAPLRPLSVDGISTEDVLAVLTPIWQTHPETASRLRGRIERVLDAAKAKGLRGGENPARWRGHLALLLPKRLRLTRGHHAAMPFADVPGFYTELAKRQAISARALQFTILTASRTSEALGAKASEFDLSEALWTVPANRMKMGVEHRVPLQAEAVAIVKALWPANGKGIIFRSNARTDVQLSGMSMAMQMRKMGYGEFTVHGFRSSFRDWAGEKTVFPREVSEAALAHAIGDKVERAYRRGDALEKRRKLMDAWAAYCVKASGKVIVIAR